MMLPSSYAIHPNCTLVTTKQRYFDVRYCQVYLNLKGLSPGCAILDIPIGPPLARAFQIFQMRLTSHSSNCEWSMHTKPYAECSGTDWVFKAVSDNPDELLQETWLVPNCSQHITPYLFFSFKELGGKEPGNSRLEMRITG